MSSRREEIARVKNMVSNTPSEETLAEHTKEFKLDIIEVGIDKFITYCIIMAITLRTSVLYFSCQLHYSIKDNELKVQLNILPFNTNINSITAEDY